MSRGSANDENSLTALFVERAIYLIRKTLPFWLAEHQQVFLNDLPLRVA